MWRPELQRGGHHGSRGGRGGYPQRGGYRGHGAAASAPQSNLPRAYRPEVPLPPPSPPYGTSEGDSGHRWIVWKEDVVAWMRRMPDNSLPHLMVGIPDISEMRAVPDKSYRIYDVDPYEEWFEEVCRLILQKVRRDAYACFFQTDRTLRRPTPRRLSKFALVASAARKEGVPMLWHKIVTIGADELGPDSRPTYSHLACFSRTLEPGPVTPDVILVGKKLWANGTATNSVDLFLDLVEHAQWGGAEDRTKGPPPPEKAKAALGIVDLFAGEGTVAWMALERGHTNIQAIDIDEEHCASMKKRFTEALATEPPPAKKGRKETEEEEK